mgnify:CR=1 FL=1
MAWKKARCWTDLTPDQNRRRMAWTRGGGVLGPDGPPLPVDPEVHRLAAAIRERIRARRVAEGRV